MIKTISVVSILFVALAVCLMTSCGKEREVSFSQEVLPLLKKRCAGCHYPGNEFNESQLVLVSYESLMEGGVHGSPVVKGQSENSLIIKKLSATPPFGQQMPMMSKQKLTSEEVSLIGKWIDQGANNN